MRSVGRIRRDFFELERHLRHTGKWAVALAHYPEYVTLAHARMIE
jgi:hypothetical protein